MAAGHIAFVLLPVMLSTVCAQDHQDKATQFPAEKTAQAETVKAPGLDAMVSAARADAAKRSGLAADSFELVGAERVTWRDGSLGCPAPGMSYTMALVPGYRIRLRTAGQVLDYHASMRGTLVLCPADRSVEPLPGDHRV
jgi:hypothetical protein